MAKVRVYELAKELGTTSKKLIEVMEGMDIEVKNHMSTLDDEEARRVMAILTGQAESAESKKKKAPRPDEDKKDSPTAAEKEQGKNAGQNCGCSKTRRLPEEKAAVKKSGGSTS